jgi:hypothetical protein
MSVKELADQIASLSGDLAIDADKQTYGNKAAGRRARKASSRIGKLCKELRRVSVDLDR